MRARAMQGRSGYFEKLDAEMRLVSHALRLWSGRRCSRQPSHASIDQEILTNYQIALTLLKTLTFRVGLPLVKKKLRT